MQKTLLMSILLFIGCSYTYTPVKKLTMLDYNSGIKQKIEREVALQRLENAKNESVDTSIDISEIRALSLFHQEEAERYIKEKNYNKALSALKRALKIEEDIYWNKKENIDGKKFATNCSKIKTGKETLTKYLQKECRNHTIWDAKNLGEVYYRLAFVYSKLDKDKKALEYYEKALDARDSDFDDKHPENTADFYNNFSLFLNKEKVYKRAFYYQKQASEIYLKLKLNAYKNLTNDKKKQFLAKDTYTMHNIVSLAFDVERKKSPKEKREILRTAFKFWLIAKGDISNRESYFLEFKRWGASAEEKLLVDVYFKRTREYSDLTLTKLLKRENFTSEEQNKLDTVTNERKMLEEYLTPEIDRYSRSNGGVSMQNPNTIKLSVISKNLKSNELYLDFVKTKKYFYLFTFDSKEHIALYRLDKVEKIEQLVQKFREKIINKENTKNTGSELYKILLGEVSNLDRYKQLIISPDGLLNLLPFEALWSNSKKYLIENINIRYVLSGKELFKTREQSRETLGNREIVVLSYLDYSLGKKTIPLIDFDRQKGGKNIGLIFHNLQGLPKLESTKEEGLFMKNIFETNRSFMFREKNVIKSPVTILTEKNATKEMLFSLNSPQILHLSTHSFYGKDDSLTTLNPLLKSSIALSEFNAIDLDDMRGLMSALEFSTLNLKNTELILFSSCQSGLGDIYTSEGVSGLNRGARMTGARRVISTLWSVDENKSLMLTKTFYKHLVKNSSRYKLGHQYRDEFHYGHALEATKLDMINKKLHPFYWAGFIMYGLDSFFEKKSNDIVRDIVSNRVGNTKGGVIEKVVDTLFDKLLKFK